MKKLFPSFAPPHKWRDEKQGSWMRGSAWRELRQKVLERDEYACAYCGFRSPKFQIVDHIDGDPENNSNENLQVICQMCNLVKHAGMGCVITGVVDLYRKSNCDQNQIMQLTRKMREAGASDDRIIRVLGLEEKARFRMNESYLQDLYAFVTSRRSLQEDDLYNHWLDYSEEENTRERLAIGSRLNASLLSFVDKTRG